MAAPVKVSPPVFIADPIPGTIRVVKVTGERGEEEYELLPHVRALGDSWREGGNPPTAEFLYKFDDTIPDNTDPTRFEEVFPLDAPHPAVIQPDDRIAILMDRPDGSTVVMWDGFALAPDAQLSATGESCPFAAMGLPVREFDIPILGALWRDSDLSLNPHNGVWTDLPARFNPDGMKNASPFKDDGEGEGGNSADYIATAPGLPDSPPFPIFMEPDFKGIDPVLGDPGVKESARSWTLLMAVKYLLMGNDIETYTRRPDFDALEHILVTRVPKGNATTYDPRRPSTYDELDILCQDYDATDKPWPIAVEELIGPHGFACAWRLDTTKDGLPDWWFDIYRRDEAITVQPLKLQPAGDVADPGQSNLTALSLTRDSREMINAFAVQTEPNRYQAWFVLAPGFEIQPSHAAAASSYDNPDPDTAAARNDYRVFHLNENGADGFWDGSGWNYTPADLRKLIRERGLDPTPLITDGDPFLTRRYAVHRRPALKTLFDKDPTGKKLHATLWIAVGYDGGPVPGLRLPQVSETLVLRSVQNGGWELLGDRCGVRLTCQKPNGWDIGKSPDPASYFSDGRVNVVECLAAPNATAGKPYFNLMLQCVIEGDRGLTAVARKRPASPTKYTTIRRDDGRDRYKGEYVLEPSGSRSATRLDLDAAYAHACARRAAHELPRFAGQATIGRIVCYYWIGDKTDRIVGRDCSLRTTIAAGQQEGAQYPSIVGIDHRYDPEFATILQYDDRRAEPFMAGKEGDLDN